MNNAEVLIKFKADDSEVDKKTSGLPNKLGSLAKGIGKAFVAGTAVAGTALTGLVGKSVQMAGELEQQLGGTEAVFGDFAEQVQDMSKKAFSKAGLSANDYMATMNKMGALMQGSGLDTEKSMELSSQAMQRAADVASIMGIDINFAMESIAGAAKGNFTMMDNLGVAMNATTIEAYALSKGINKTYSQMTKAEQVEMAMEMFLEKSTYAMGNYEKENETFAGSLQTMKSAFTNFLSGAGNIDDVIKSVTSFGNILMKSIQEMAPKVIEGIVGLINGIMPQLPALIEKLLPTVLDGVIMLTQGIINSLPSLLQMLTGMLPTILQSLITGATTIVSSLATMLPTLLPQIIDALLSIIPLITQNIPLIMDTGIQLLFGLIDGLINAIPSLIESIPEIIEALVTTLIAGIPRIIAAAPMIIYELAKAIIYALPTLVYEVPKIIGAIVNGLIGGLVSLKDVGKNLVKGLWDGMWGTFDWLKNKIKGFADSILGGIKGFFGIHSPSKEFAIVGEYNMLGLEKGMEDMQPEIQKDIDGLFDLSPSMTGSMNNTLSPMINVYNDVLVEQDPLGQMVSNIKTFSGGAKNDYNYGMGV